MECIRMRDAIERGEVRGMTKSHSPTFVKSTKAGKRSTSRYQSESFPQHVLQQHSSITKAVSMVKSR